MLGTPVVWGGNWHSIIDGCHFERMICLKIE